MNDHSAATSCGAGTNGISRFILPHPTDFQFFVLRVVASLSAAAIASVVPGVIEVKLEGWASKMLRVGAAVAVFIATYLFFSLKL
jgi:hypothetical protein